MTVLAKAALDVAITQIGQEEHPRGSNWGEPVKTYLHSVGIDFPASWCMALVYWCYDKAAKGLSLASVTTVAPLNPLLKTGGVLRQYNERPKYQVAGAPQAGDIFIMDHGHGLGHTGLVESVNGAIVHTVEGNTNDTGSREGYEVCRRTRSISSIKGFLRF